MPHSIRYSIKTKNMVLPVLFSLIFSLSPSCIKTQENRPYLETAERILKKGLKEQEAYSLLTDLVAIGHRLTGSLQAARAVQYTHKKMLDLGFENVHLEPITVPHWVRGAPEEGRLESTQLGSHPLSVCAIGGSISTPEKGVSAEVVEVKSFEELQKLNEKAEGKIVFFNRPMDPSLLNTFGSYGGAADQRVRGAVEAAKAGAVAALVRSLTMRLDDFPHTGLMIYDSEVPKIPAACISTKGAAFLSDSLKKDPSLRVYLKLNCQNLPPVISHNVVGQITGSERPDEIILIGGHLDSWDLGTGAHDDGAGCVQSIEALRFLKELGLQPKRTIRAVMFMNEEFGGSGGRDYARADERKGEVHIAAIEADRGGFLPLGFGVGGNPRTIRRLQRWEYLLQSIGMCWIRRGGGGVDIAPLAEQGTILMDLVTDSQSYFDLHHSAKDILSAVHPRHLELGAVAMAVFAYVLAQEGI
jgi:carboxypeptidase Q